VLYLVVPRDLAVKLHEPLRRHFAEDRSVQVIVERRGTDRRAGVDRRAVASKAPAEADRRKVRAVNGRRVADRRSSIVKLVLPELPRKARPYAERLVLVERLEPTVTHAEDLDTARLIARFQAGDREAFADLYLRYFGRVYGYLNIALNDPHAAEDATQHVFMRVLENLDRYERRRQPFRAWLFKIVRNHAITAIQQRSRVDVSDPSELPERPARHQAEVAVQTTLGWITDPEVLMLIERLPLQQRQVLVLRYLVDLHPREIARVLNTSSNHVSVLHYRAIGFLRDRLTALGAEAPALDCGPMRRRPKQARILRRRRFALTP
jgi:RNA polymerase sigma-70 factor (ECF subfamily)